MATKICMNASCGATTSHEWKRGWPLRSGGYVDLCYTCGSAYENSVYCDTFHSEDSGWRECFMCKKRLHCGCIASKSLLELLDYGGVVCTGCARSPELHLIQCDEIPNGFGSLARNNASFVESTRAENKAADNRVDDGKLAQLCRLVEANESNLLHELEGAEANACLGKFKQDEVTHSIREVGVWSSKVSRLENGSPVQPSLSMMLGVPAGTANGISIPGEVNEGMEQGKTPSSCQQGQGSHLILPKPSKSGVAVNLETNKVMVPELRIARPPAEGRGKNQLLPRYWPRITDQELQQLSGHLNSKIVPLFEKVLSASDAGRIGRLVLPKACAEAYFPPISHSEGLPLRIQDVKGKEWTFQFRFWPNNNSRMYVLEGVTPCIQSMQLRAGDTITFSQIEPGNQLIIGYRRATNKSLDTQDGQTSALPNGSAVGETSINAGGDTGWNKSDNNGGRINGDSLQQSTATEKKRTRNIGPKSKRLLMHSEDALELRLTWEEAQDLLRPSLSVKPSVVTIDDHEFEEYDEPPVFGKRTVFTALPSGGLEQWTQCDDCYKWRKLPLDALIPLKWTCSDNVWDSSRSTCSAPEEMSPKDLDNLFRMSRELKKRKIMENNRPSKECEPSGLDALASAAVLGDNAVDSAEPSIGATTKHPRHRPGCTCIVCIQPPSGKGKHKPNCTCNVCLTVKRRFKTLMLRKKKRQSECVAEISQKDNSERRDEFEKNGTLHQAALQINPLENEGSQSKKQTELAETSTTQIDLNIHPCREDMQVDITGLNLIGAKLPLDGYIKPNGIASLMCEQQANLSSCLLAQNNGEGLKRMSDEAFLSSIGWDRSSRGD